LSNSFENIDDLLGKYLAGEASEEERLRVRNWLSADEANLLYFDHMKLIFEKAAAVSHLQEFDTDGAWMRLRASLREGSSGVVPIRRSPDYSLWYKVAATLIVVCGIAWFLFRSTTGDQIVPPIELVSEKTAVSDTLPGGSDVFLNKESRVVYAYDDKKQSHKVKLSGEAYFNIKKQDSEDFIIDAGDVFIRDIGTSFNVRAYPDSDEVEVLVEDGEVRFFTADNNGISLKASGKGVYNKKTKTFSIEQPEPNITAYKTRFFVFSATDLGSMATALNNVYDTEVVVADNIRNCSITVTFRDEPIEEIMAVVSETLGLTARTEGNRIILEGHGCE
jgi:transmembrane sensor